MGKGKLVRVEIGPGRYGMMHRQDAVEAGLVAAPKRRKPAEDKMRRPEADKSGRDDFTTIRGIGAMTARRLYERGIFTFEQLRTADVSDLPGRARWEIKNWRSE